MTKILLRCNGLCKNFGSLKAVSDVDLNLYRGEIHAVIGSNGAGKTTLVSLLSGQLAPSSGSIEMKGLSVTRLSSAERVHLGLARTFQITSLFFEQTVKENLLIALSAGAKQHWNIRLTQYTDRALETELSNILESLELTRIAERKVGELAHGTRRYVELAVALASDPEILLLDEPMAGVPAMERDRLTETIVDLKSRGLGIIFVEHDVDLVMSIADRISVMHDGRVLICDIPERVRSDDRVRKSYLG